MRDQLSRRLSKLELGQLAGTQSALEESRVPVRPHPDDGASLGSSQHLKQQPTARQDPHQAVGTAGASMRFYVLTRSIHSG